MVGKLPRLTKLLLRRKERPSGQEALTGWQIFTASVQGARHKQAEPAVPNQDAIGSWTYRPGELPLIVALADGHGSSAHGDLGAQIAISVALDVLRAFLTSDLLELGRSQVRDVVQERVTRELVRKWQERVLELAQARQKENGDESPERSEVLESYGATLLIVALWADALPDGEAEYPTLFFQLGDGDILTVSEESAVHRPLSRDERFLGNETLSLSLPAAWEQFRVRLDVYSGSVPALILMSSDGYANSFQDDAGFLQVGSDLLALLRQEALPDVEAALPAWLAATSEAGSGDDISLGVVCRMEALIAEGK